MKKSSYLADAIELFKLTAFGVYCAFLVVMVVYIVGFAFVFTVNLITGNQIKEGTISHITEGNGGRSFTFYQRKDGEMQIGNYFTRDEKLMETIRIGDFFNTECMCVLPESEIKNEKYER